jgi:hypothetical protein
MATKPKLTSLFKGKDTPAEEKKEGQAVKAGKISVKDYVRGEKSEGDGKGAASRGKALKTGKMSPAQYAKKESK